MTFLAVWLQCGLKRDAIDGAFDRSHAARREFRTSVLWQDEKAPVGCRALIGPRAGRLHCRPEEFRFEMDLGSSLRHLPSNTNRLAIERQFDLCDCSFQTSTPVDQPADQNESERPANDFQPKQQGIS